MTKREYLSNDIADEIVRKMQAARLSNTHDAATTQKFMELVSGVDGYNIYDMARQGVISKYFNREIRTPYNNEIPSNFSMSFEDIVSIFWEQAYKALSDAKMTGDDVSVRVVSGQTSDAPISKINGIDRSIRVTLCNPINYIRKNAITKTRNVITNAYSRALTQECQDCGHSSSPRKNECATNCSKCLSSDTKESYPDGTSMYRSKKIRSCNKCGHTWARKFKYTCQICLSTNVTLEQRTKGIDESILQIPGDLPTTEESRILKEKNSEVTTLLRRIRNSLPKDPQDSSSKTVGQEIFDMFIDPEVGRAVCTLCIENAKMTCKDKCGNNACTHEKIKDPEYTCGSKTFSLGTCINYTKRLSDYYGCSTSLTSRRVKRNRLYAIRYIVKHKDTHDLCDSIYNMLKQRGIYKEYETKI